MPRVLKPDGSVPVRGGKGGPTARGREDEWAWEQIEPWLAVRLKLPVGRLAVRHQRDRGAGNRGQARPHAPTCAHADSGIGARGTAVVPLPRPVRLRSRPAGTAGTAGTTRRIFAPCPPAGAGRSQVQILSPRLKESPATTGLSSYPGSPRQPANGGRGTRRWYARDSDAGPVSPRGPEPNGPAHGEGSGAVGQGQQHTGGHPPADGEREARSRVLVQTAALDGPPAEAVAQV